MRTMSSIPGCGSAGVKWRASATFASSESTSSGSAITTGPRRPEVATWNARAITSGMRFASSIRVAHFASGANIAAKSTSWNASRPRKSEPTSPTRRIIGVESWNAVCTPIAACDAPGPRVTIAMPGRLVSLP